MRDTKLCVYCWDNNDTSLQKKTTIATLTHGLLDKTKQLLKHEEDSFLGWAELMLREVTIGDDGTGSVHDLPLQKRSRKSHVEGGLSVQLALCNLCVRRPSRSTSSTLGHRSFPELVPGVVTLD